MKRFVPREKLGKKAHKQLDSEQRTTWTFSPVTKKVESKKLYNRKQKSHDRYDDYGMGFVVKNCLISYLFVKLAHIDSAIYLSRSILQLFYVMYFNIYTIK